MSQRSTLSCCRAINSQRFLEFTKEDLKKREEKHEQADKFFDRLMNDTEKRKTNRWVLLPQVKSVTCLCNNCSGHQDNCPYWVIFTDTCHCSQNTVVHSKWCCPYIENVFTLSLLTRRSDCTFMHTCCRHLAYLEPSQHYKIQRRQPDTWRDSWKPPMCFSKWHQEPELAICYWFAPSAMAQTCLLL